MSSPVVPVPPSSRSRVLRCPHLVAILAQVQRATAPTHCLFCPPAHSRVEALRGGVRRRRMWEGVGGRVFGECATLVAVFW